MSASYVYLLIHAPSRRLYIGSHKGDDLWSSYFTGSKVVQSMSADEFIPVILSAHNTRQEAYEEEQRLHELYQVHRDDRFLNRALANGKFTTAGMVLDDEWRRKMSEAKTGKRRSDYERQRISEGRTGMSFTEEHKRNLSKSHMGNKHSEETKRKMSETRRRKGFKHSEETKRKIAETKRRRAAASADTSRPD